MQSLVLRAGNRVRWAGNLSESCQGLLRALLIRTFTASKSNKSFHSGTLLRNGHQVAQQGLMLNVTLCVSVKSLCLCAVSHPRFILGTLITIRLLPNTKSFLVVSKMLHDKSNKT